MIPLTIPASIMFVSSGFLPCIQSYIKMVPNFLPSAVLQQGGYFFSVPQFIFVTCCSGFPLFAFVYLFVTAVYFFRSLPSRIKTISISPSLKPQVSGPSYSDHLVYSAAKYALFPPTMNTIQNQHPLPSLNVAASTLIS